MKKIFISIMVAFMLSLAPLAGTTASAAVPATNDEPCLVFQNHVYEVCSAYIANSSTAVLLPYYKYAHSQNSALRRYVSYRLGSRYVGRANDIIAARVATWPAGNFDVPTMHIRIISAVSSLQTNTATLVTEESWTVEDEQGHVAYQEVRAHHTVTMQRVPSYILHKWVVSDIHP